MKCIIKQIFSLLLVLSLLGASITAYAYEEPDSSKTGSISVTMSYDGAAVPGGAMTLYRAGEISEVDGNYCFVPAGSFVNYGETFENFSSTELAVSLAAYASANNLTGKTVLIGDDGRANAEGLELGLYLVVQTNAADGYEAVTPFLVSIPAYDHGVYVYDIDATPKLSTLKETKPTYTTPTKPTGSTLPQTGQLNWPVPILAALGLLLFLLGWALHFGKRERHDEV